ncbi:hypothetical protein [Micromonospora zamorensis]|uniref:hypothetical protein n=1 Tax=Micromonospora zamorensis TaxID=709883 RepID=UPI00378D62DC
MDNDDKVRENRLRRSASRQRVTLTKRRRIDPRAWDYGRFDLYDHQGNRLNDDNGLTIDQVETHLIGDPNDGADEQDDDKLVGTPVG